MVKKTKTERIMVLYVDGYSTREIADRVECDPAYVRVVARQRKGKGQSKHDRKYASALRAHADYEKARRASRKAYRDAVKAGLTRHEATKAAGHAHVATIRKTGRIQRNKQLEAA